MTSGTNQQKLGHTDLPGSSVMLIATSIHLIVLCAFSLHAFLIFGANFYFTAQSLVGRSLKRT